MKKKAKSLMSFVFSVLSSPIWQVITWFQNRRAKMKRDMEEIKKDVETVKTLSSQKSFLENITDMNILKSKSFHIHGEKAKKSS